MGRRVRVERVALAVALVAAPSLVVVPAAVAAPTLSATQVRAGQWWLSKFDVTRAWSVTRGEKATVAVLDSGVNPSHPDLRGAVVGGKDFSGTGAANGERPVAGDEHGTAMAGYIAGRGHGAGNAQGLIGVAPAAKLLSVSVGSIQSGDTLDGGGTDLGLRWAVDHGAKVINMSFGGGGLTAADIAYAQGHDVVLVGATGNDGLSQLDTPDGFLGVVAVSGVDQDLATDPSSTTGGPGILDTSGPDEALGGVAVAGPYADRSGGLVEANGVVGLTNTGYNRSAGTSNATAVVSGIVALIRSAHPELNAANVVNRLIQTARHLNPAGRGYTPEQGFGIPDAYRAVTADIPQVCENPLGSLAAPQSFGAWKAIAGNTKYVPACQGGGASTSPTSGSSGSSGGSQSAPVSGSSSSGLADPPSSSSDSGVPVWVWPVVAVVVIALVGLLVLGRRRRSRPAGPGGPPGPGGYGPPGGPPPGGWGGPGHGPPGRG